MKYYHVQVTVKSEINQVEFEFDLSFDELSQRFLDPYARGNAIVVNGRTVQMDRLEQIRISSSDVDSGTINSQLRYEQHQRRSFSSVDAATGRLADSLLFERATDVTRQFIIGPPGYQMDKTDASRERPRPTTSMRVFISHSSSDVEIAKLLIDLLRKALHLRSDEIRCTSVDGYRMPGGASIDERLRAEVHDAELLIGLITPNSLGSAYVTFELGARWGADKHMIPLLASGVTPGLLGGPLAGINALDSSVDGQVHQFLEDAAKCLRLNLDKASSYAAAVDELARMASESTPAEESQPGISDYPQLSSEARELLIEATNDRDRLILVTRMMVGVAIRTNGKGFGEMGDPRSEAKWLHAIEELQIHRLIERYSGEGEAYEVTHKGFQVADAFACK